MTQVLVVAAGAFLAGQVAFWGLVLVGLRTGHLRWSGEVATDAHQKP